MVTELPNLERLSFSLSLETRCFLDPLSYSAQCFLLLGYFVSLDHSFLFSGGLHVRYFRQNHKIQWSLSYESFPALFFLKGTKIGGSTEVAVRVLAHKRHKLALWLKTINWESYQLQVCDVDLSTGNLPSSCTFLPMFRFTTSHAVSLDKSSDCVLSIEGRGIGSRKLK